MSFYSDANVATKYLDPRIYVPAVNGNGRVTFDLDANEVAYLPNMRLTNLGVTIAAKTDYNKQLGALAMIKNIRLLDGKVTLCSQNRFNFHRGFVNINKPNSVCEAVTSKLECSGLGWTVDGTTGKINRMAKVNAADVNDIDNTANATNGAWLDLREVFPMLNSISHLPTEVFKNLRLEIELNNTPDNQLAVSTVQNMTSIRPILVVDVLENPTIVEKMNNSLQGATWLEVEHDQFIIPATATDGAAADQLVVQNVNVKLNGFNNKHLERLLISKECDASLENNAGAVRGLGRYSSQACFRQELQYRVNGRNILPAMDTKGNNRRLAQIVDNYGDCFSYVGSNQYGGDASAELQDARNLLGQLDYMGTYVGEYIADLQLVYKRTGLQDATNKRITTQRLTVHCFGEVRKVLQLQNGGQYRIAYAQ
jgi:hypothetical protein